MSKSKLANSRRTIVTSFLVLVSGTAEYRLRKIHNLGQSRHFAFGREHDKEATVDLIRFVVMILSAYYVMAQRYDVILQVSQIEIRNFAEKREKKLEKNTTHHSQQYTLLFYQQSYQPRTCPLRKS